jgi:hypothetical protein
MLSLAGVEAKVRWEIYVCGAKRAAPSPFLEFQQGRRSRTRVGDQKNIDYDTPGNAHEVWLMLLSIRYADFRTHHCSSIRILRKHQ